MKKLLPIIFIVLLLPLSAFAAEQKIYMLRLNYEAGSLSADAVFVTVAHFNEEKNRPENAYRLELASFDNTILYTKKFSPVAHRVYGAKPEWFDARGDQIYFPDESENLIDSGANFIELMVPYFKNGKMINVYDSYNEKVLEIDVGHFAQVCGDGACQPHENPSVCPQDCANEFEKNAEKQSPQSNKGFSIGAALAVSMALIAMLATFGFIINKIEHKKR